MAERQDDMSKELSSVKVEHAAMDESPLRGGTIILRGVVTVDTLKNLKVDTYQREALPITSLRKLIAAIKRGDVLPDIEIGMRGARTRDGKDNVWFLQDDCYIIDGQQRTNACLAVAAQAAETPIRLGATIHFNTDYDWERHRFRVLNADRAKVSPNVLLRNLREDHPAVHMLHSYTDAANAASFCLAGRVSWSQKMRRGDLVTALNFCKVVIRLHSHITSASRGQTVDEVGGRLDAIAETITPTLMRDNVKLFFNMIDEIWGVRSVQYKELAPQLKGTFLYTLARLLSNHTDFWRNAANGRLFMDVDLKRKLALFKLRDPNIAALTSSTGPAHHLLYEMLVRHLNSGRRKDNWLTPRPTADAEPVEDEQEAEAA